VFESINERQRQLWFELPHDIERIHIDPRNGKQLTNRSPRVKVSREELISPLTRLSAATERDYDPTSGAALLPTMYAKWASSPDNRYGDLVKVSAHDPETAWRIVTPVEGQQIRLDPDLESGRSLHLTSDAAGLVQWSCTTLPIIFQGNSAVAVLKPGKHEIKASYQGMTKTVHVTVIE
jgi:hypothetical protein